MGCGERAFVPDGGLVSLVHIEAELAVADSFEAVSAGAFCAVASAADLECVCDIVDLHAIFGEYFFLECGVMDDFDEFGICEDLSERGDVDREWVDDIGLVFAADLDEAEALIGECGFDIEADKGHREDVVDGIGE